MAASSPRHKEENPSDSRISWTNPRNVKHQTNIKEEEMWRMFTTQGNYTSAYNLGEEAVVKTLFEDIPHISSRGLPTRQYLARVDHGHGMKLDQPLEKQRDSARTSPEKSIARERCTVDAAGNITLMTETVYKCNKCDKTFFTRSGYRKHQKNHMEDSRYVCNSCGETFMDCSTYNMHKVSHRKDHECDKHFRQQAHLTMQEMTHVGDTCHVCGKYFGQSSNLISHMRNHAGE
ncbi:zinc finger protein 677-like [Spea bombifrons]|uniref:zinc finger protein 677-like n=1 Tax=Spea bombifrons TaxID=233779 RepID=UPI00234AFF69|nr:zinc finger protein 677-like [Spea bombifrons]